MFPATHDRAHSGEVGMRGVADHARSLASSMSWYVHTLLSEVRSLPHRIQMLSRKTNRQSVLIDLGPAFEENPNGEISECKATIARTQYVEFLLSRFPWASDADILLALDGWDRGTEYLLRTNTSNMGDSASREQYPLTLVGD